MTVRIENLQRHTGSIEDLSVTHFDLWGPLTSRNTLEEYQSLLERAVAADGLPSTLVAEENRAILGSVNVLDSDLPIRSDLTPWLAQLFVFPEYRHQGIGSLLVDAAISEARRLSHSAIYLYTSGSLPKYYEGLGWSRLDEVEYLDKLRVIMAYNIEIAV